MTPLTITKAIAEEIILHDARKAAIRHDDNDAHSRWWKRAHDFEKAVGLFSFADCVLFAKGFLHGIEPKEPFTTKKGEE